LNHKTRALVSSLETIITATEIKTKQKKKITHQSTKSSYANLKKKYHFTREKFLSLQPFYFMPSELFILVNSAGITLYVIFELPAINRRFRLGYHSFKQGKSQYRSLNALKA